MTIELYGKKDCKLCADAEKKLQLMRVEYTKYDIEYFGALHEGWREDESTTVMAHHCLVNQQIPMLIVDGKAYNYTGAMKAIKGARKH